jgi:uncharacterized membrane protein
MTTLRPRSSTQARVFDALSFFTIAATFAVTASFYGRLPARVPIHFDIHGQADGFAPRGLGTWIMPGTMIFLLAFIRLGAWLLPRDWRARTQGDAAATLILVITLGFAALHFLMMRVALTGGASLGASLGVVLGAMWIGLGLVMPRLRRNPWMGVRTAWTLSSDENWARTHRVAGLAMTIGGTLAVIAALAGSMPIAIAIVLISGLGPVVYSFFLARNLAGR